MTQVRKTIGSLMAVLLAGAIAVAGDADSDQKTVVKALKKGGFGATLRYRLEGVDDSAVVADDKASASTLRSTVFYRSARFHGFSIFAELEDVHDLGLDDQHRDLGAPDVTNGVTGRPVIADPEITEVNQAFVRYQRIPGTKITAGRQEITLGNQRFVGNVGWRQNHQSFDALRIEQSSIPRTKLSYVLVENVNRIFGDNQDMQGHLLDATVELGKQGSLMPYVYHLDFQSPAAAELRTRTTGLRWSDEQPVCKSWSIPYVLEAARQIDIDGNPIEVDADYYRVEVGAAREGVWLKLGHERLEGSATDGKFTTPLATLHGQNGWADRFLNTPDDGLEDTYLAVGGAKGSFTGQLVLHDFRAESTDVQFGKELDAMVVYTSSWKQTFGLKLALFDADAPSGDVDKAWFWTGYRF